MRQFYQRKLIEDEKLSSSFVGALVFVESLSENPVDFQRGFVAIRVCFGETLLCSAKTHFARLRNPFLKMQPFARMDSADTQMPSLNDPGFPFGRIRKFDLRSDRRILRGNSGLPNTGETAVDSVDSNA